MPTDAWKEESITSIRSKLTFIFNTFVVPYLDEDSQRTLRNSLGITSATLNEKGIIRFRYTHDGQTISDESAMNTAFLNKTVESRRLLSIVDEDDTIPVGTRYAYEYVGFLNVPEEADYQFGVNSDDAADIYVNRNRVAHWYTSASHSYNTPKTLPGGNFSTTTRLTPGQYPIRIRYVRSLGNGNSKLTLLWKKSTDATFSVLGCENLYHDPSVMNVDVSMVDERFSPSDLVANILDFDRFGQYFGTMSQAMTDSVSNNLTKILISQNNNAYTNYNSATSVIPALDVNNPNVITGDISYQEFLNSIKTVSNGNAIQQLLDYISSIRLIYNLLEDNTIENIKAGNPVQVAVYGVDDNTKRTVTYSTSQINTQLPEFVATMKLFTRVEYFIFRRILLLMDLVLHAHISMFLFKQAFTANNPNNVNKTKLSQMVIFFVQRLKRLNVNFGMMFESTPNMDNNSIVSTLYGNVREFNARSEEINQLDQTVKESKNALKSKNNMLKGQKQLYSSASKWALFATILTIIVITSLIAYAIMVRMNPSLKWIGGISLALFAALVALAFYFIKIKKMEGFVGGGMYQEQILSNILTNSDAIGTITSAYYVDTMKEMDMFIQNTINMALILQNNNAYKYINYNLQKEANYYNGVKLQMDNATASANASERMYNLYRRNDLSKMNVFIALIIILTFAVVGYTLADGRVTIQYIVLTIASLLLLIVAILYILDTQSKVRTNGTKLYWGQPNEMIQKLK